MEMIGRFIIVLGFFFILSCQSPPDEIMVARSVLEPFAYVADELDSALPNGAIVMCMNSGEYEYCLLAGDFRKAREALSE